MNAIEFDETKRQDKLINRGLDMVRSTEVFDGATLTVSGDRHDYGEERMVTTGYLDQRMIVVVWTRREDARRIISMRKANEREQNHYEPKLG